MIQLILMISLLILYTGLIVWSTKRVVDCFIQQDLDELKAIQSRHEGLLRVKVDLELERKKIETEVAEIFTLYDLTREMTKTFSEEQTFATFKAKLAEKIAFKDCVLLDPLAEDDLRSKEVQGYAVLPLVSQRRNLGHLALDSIGTETIDTLNILGNQFALALRRVRLYQDIERLAITDGLTEVHTRRYVMERFEEERLRAEARKSHVSFFMVDIDFFKRYNDQYGHLTGDQILREIAYLLKTHIREIDIVGRYGGEEFCVVLPDADHQAAGFVAERIRSAVQKAVIKAYDATTTATVSIGISVYPQDGKTTAELIDKADWALYRAKKQGRNRVCAFGVYEIDRRK